MNDPILHPASERLQAFVENALETADRVVVESHILGCPQCQGDVEEWRSLFTVLAAMPQFEPRLDFTSRVMAHITLPDPWYVRTAARVGNRVHVLVPKTTRGWAAAAACFAIPLGMFGALVFWVLSKPYLTPQGLVSFAIERTQTFMSGVVTSTLSSALQSDVALFAVRSLSTLANAGLGAAGALAATVAMATALSAWVLYQNLFRTTTRENRSYVSYSF